MFARLLVANRGEIARRILRTARAMGIRTAVVYSEADRAAPYLDEADDAIPIGGWTPRESYLDARRIVAEARRWGAQAIHPGYGFLAENAEFARTCAEAGIVFVGPPADVLERCGDKIGSRRLAESAGVPTVPGESRPCSLEDVRAFAARHGYPVLLKAAAGGGGRGMRVVREERELERAFPAAQREAESAFGDPSLFVERYFTDVRHVEVQILADAHGGIVHLFERDCSIQRRHQKLVEESPSPGLDDRARTRLCDAAVRLCRAAGYVNAGTCEFLVEPDGKFYFLEINARIQVEHPVTEVRTGRDLVADQIRIASGERLGFSQEDVRAEGHAVEVRVCAEDPFRRFLPVAGTVRALVLPSGHGVRVDTALAPGVDVPPYYDSLLAKVIAHGPDRTAALDRLAAALAQMRISGPATTLPFFRRLVCDSDFRAGRVNTRFIPDHLSLVTYTDADVKAAAAAAALVEARRLEAVEAALRDGVPVSRWRRT